MRMSEKCHRCGQWTVGARGHITIDDCIKDLELQTWQLRKETAEIENAKAKMGMHSMEGER